MRIQTGKQSKPRRILLYGVHGVGKSSWAANAPKAIFLNFEDGLADIDCAKTDYLKTYADGISAVSWLLSNPHDYKTVVVDTADWLQQAIYQQVAADAGKPSVEAIPYSKGYKLAVDKWKFFMAGLERLREDKRMGIIFLAHAKIKTFESPESDRYDRYEPDLHDLASSMLQEWCDEVLFASFRVFVRTEDLGFGKNRQIAQGGKERFIRTNESASALAKNRLRLPDELPMEWSAYAAHLVRQAEQSASEPTKHAGIDPSDMPPPGTTTKLLADHEEPTNIDGIVTNGSSKKKELTHG